MNVVYFFRKTLPGAYSIEELFGNIQRHFHQKITISNYAVKYKSKGIFRRIFNSLEAAFNQKDINHITGDIHYIAYFLSKKKTILTIHDVGSIINGPWLKRMIIKFFWFTVPARNVRYITVVSEFTKQELLKHVHIDPSKILVIYDCISPSITYEPKKFNENKPVILQIGTKANKNLENLTKAIEGISCRLLVVGRLSSSQRLMLTERNINYENFHDLEFTRVIDLYNKADLLTFVSTYEGFGIPVIEANAIGRPVIASNISSMPEVARDAALLVDPDNANEIREAILRVINENDLREQLIRKGLENAKRFDAELIAMQYYELYSRIYSS